MGIEALAAMVVGNVLVPLVSDGATALGNALSQRAGSSGQGVVDVAARIWKRVQSAFGSDVERATLEQFEKYPEDSRMLVERLLREKLEQDPQLQQELQALVDERPAGVSHSVGTIMGEYVANVDASHSTINAPVIGQSFGAMPPGRT